MFQWLKQIFKSDTPNKSSILSKMADTLRPGDFSIYPKNPEVKNIWLARWNFKILTLTKEDEHYYRRQRAFKTVPLRIDPGSLDGNFLGSEGEVYDTSLEKCTCMDFFKNGLPCKHMYRLFYNLENNMPITYEDGVNHATYMSSLKETSKTYNQALKWYQDILQCIHLDGQFYCFRASYKSGISSSLRVIADDILDPLIQNNLLAVSDEKDFTYILNLITKDEIKLLLAKRKITDYKSNWTKPVLISWLIENHLSMLEKRFNRLIRLVPTVETDQYAVSLSKYLEDIEIYL